MSACKEKIAQGFGEMHIWIQENEEESEKETGEKSERWEQYR